MRQRSALFGRVAMPRGNPSASISDSTSAIRISLLLIILLGTALRFYQLGTDSLWQDETLGIMHAQAEAMSIPASLMEGGAHPPLWHLFTHFVLYLGRGEFILRFPAALMGILSIPLMYVVGQRLFSGTVGLLGAFLLTISPFHIQYSQEAHLYAAMLLFSLLSLYFLCRGLERGEESAWLGFAVSTLLNIYNAYFALLVLVSEAVFALVVVVAKSWPSKVKGVMRSFRSWFQAFSSSPQVRALALSLIIVGLLYLPWVPAAKVNLLERQSAKEEAAGAKIAVSLSVILGLAGDFSPYDEGPLFFIFIGAFLAGLLDLVLRLRWKELLLVGLWLAPPFMIIALLGGVRKLSSRYLIHLLPIYLLLVAVGISGFGSWLRGLWERCAKRQIGVRGVGMVTVAAIMGVLSIAPIEEYYSQVKENWRDITAFLTVNVRPDEVIVVEHNWSKVGIIYYNPALNEVHTSQGSSQSLQEKISGYKGVWLVLWRAQQADPRGEIRAWVEENDLLTLVGAGESGGGLFLYYGRLDAPLTVEERITLLEKAVGLFPEPRLHCDLGQAYEAIGELEKAEMEYGKGLELDPTNRRCLRELGGTYLASGRAQEVVEEYKRAVALDPELDQQAWFHLCLGRAYKQSGCREEAIREYERVLELKPGNPAARRALEALDR